MSRFEDEVAKGRAVKASADRTAARTAAEETRRREEVRRQSREAAKAALPELKEAIRVLQANARTADRQSYDKVFGLGIEN